MALLFFDLLHSIVIELVSGDKVRYNKLNCQKRTYLKSKLREMSEELLFLTQRWGSLCRDRSPGVG